MAKRKSSRPVESIIIAVVLVLLSVATLIYVYCSFRSTIIKNTLDNEADRYFSVIYVDYDDTLLVSDCYGEGLVRKTPPTPTREDFDFLGWSMNDSLRVYSTAETYNMEITQDVLFKAIYQEKQLTVKYLNDDQTVIQSITYPSSEKMPTIANPTKEGYLFTGWDTAVNGSVTTCIAMWCEEDSGYICRVGNTYYTSIHEACNTEGAEVVVFADIFSNYCLPKKNVTIRLLKDISWNHTVDSYGYYSNITPKEGFKIDTNGYTLTLVNEETKGSAIESSNSFEIYGGGKLESTSKIILTNTNEDPTTNPISLTLSEVTLKAPICLTNIGTTLELKNIKEDSRIELSSASDDTFVNISKWKLISSDQSIKNICSVICLTAETYGNAYYKLSENYNENTKEYVYSIDTSAEVVKTVLKTSNPILTGYSVGEEITYESLKKIFQIEDSEVVFYIEKTNLATGKLSEYVESVWLCPGQKHVVEDFDTYDIFAGYDTDNGFEYIDWEA